jgi:hypothetical protein
VSQQLSPDFGRGFFVVCGVNRDVNLRSHAAALTQE